MALSLSFQILASKRISAPRAKARSGRIRPLTVLARNERSRLHEPRSRRSGRPGPRRDIHCDIDRPAHRHAHPERRRDACSLDRIELPHAARHKEALEKAQNTGNTGPEEAAVEDTKAGTAQVKVVNPEGA